MRDFGSLWLCDKDADPGSYPDTQQPIPIAGCHEWDGLFSVNAASTVVRVLLTAWCDGREDGSFKIENDGRVLASGMTRVVHAPELREPDGYTFPPGSHFGAGLWSIHCIADGSPQRLVKVEVRDWDATD